MNITKGRIAEVKLPLLLEDIGTKTAEHVAVYIRIPNELAYGGQIDGTDLTGEMLKIKKIETEVVQQERFTTLVISIPRLANHEMGIFKLPLSIRHGTDLRPKFRAKTKDGVDVELETHLTYGYEITIIVTCEGAEPVSKRHTLQVFDTNTTSIAEALNTYNRLARKASESTKKNGFFSSVRNWWEFRKRAGLEKLNVYCPSKADKVADDNMPIDRYGIDHGRRWEGAKNLVDGTIWVPGLEVTVSGE